MVADVSESEAASNVHGGERGAPIKCKVPDVGDAVWYNHRGQGGAFSERIVADVGDAASNDYGGKGGTTVERPSPDSGDTVWYGHGS